MERSVHRLPANTRRRRPTRAEAAEPDRHRPVEGLHISGADLAEGIQLDQRRGAIVQLQNIRVDTVHGTQQGHHADVLQTWAGPRQLRVDGLTGSTGYQGMMLNPRDGAFGGKQRPRPELFDFRRVDISGNDKSGYLVWLSDGLRAVAAPAM